MVVSHEKENSRTSQACWVVVAWVAKKKKSGTRQEAEVNSIGRG
jgi:hypothetical protein